MYFPAYYWRADNNSNNIMNIKLQQSSDKEIAHKVYLIPSKEQLSSLGLDKGLEARFAKQLENDKSALFTGLEGVTGVAVCEELNEQYSGLEKLRNFGNAVHNAVVAEKGTAISVVEQEEASIMSFALAEGILLSAYAFTKYKAEKNAQKSTLAELLIEGAEDTFLKQLEAVVSGVGVARDLVNEPLSYLNAERLAECMMKLGNEAGFATEVFNKSKIEALKMGGTLAVNRGSVNPPTFTVMEYKPENAVNEDPIVLVGKGVVYDTGGLSLKPTPQSMDFMKSDMGGAAAVIGAVYAAAKAEVPVHMVGLVPATDNRPGGDAYVPGDVITMSDNTTVEILNTDAEGRLLLADALLYAKRYNPAMVIDVATLTGAAVVAVGTDATAVMGTVTADRMQELKESGMRTHERVVELPLWDDYKELLKSDIADMSNLGGRDAGTITAGKFLEHFTDYPWLHLDIAGPAYLHAPKTYRSSGGSGVGVRLLFDYLQSVAFGTEE